MICSYKKEIKTNTECALVETVLDGTRKIIFGICRYVQNDKATDPERPSADSFETIASNRLYGIVGSGHDEEIVTVTPVSAAELEKVTGVDSYDFGTEALEQDEWAKVVKAGSDKVIKVLADHAEQEFIDSEVDEID
jgi:hypothetical protein